MPEFIKDLHRQKPSLKELPPFFIAEQKAPLSCLVCWCCKQIQNLVTFFHRHVFIGDDFTLIQNCIDLTLV